MTQSLESSFLNSEDYEKLVQDIYQEILRQDGYENIIVQHNVDVIGRSGVKHQVDVLWTFKQANIEHRVIIECKCYKDNVSLLHARNLLGLQSDLNGPVAFLVTNAGYQKGVKQFCDFYGIGLKLVRPPEDADWDGYIQHIEVNLMQQRNIYKINVLDAKGDPSLGNISVPSDQLLIREDDSRELFTPARWLDKEVSNGELQPDGSLTISPKNTYLVLPDGAELELRALNFSVDHHFTETQINIDAKQIVKAVLQDAKNGQIEFTLHNKLKRE